MQTPQNIVKRLHSTNEILFVYFTKRIVTFIIIADIRIARIPRGYEPRMLLLHSPAITKRKQVTIPTERKHCHLQKKGELMKISENTK